MNKNMRKVYLSFLSILAIVGIMVFGSNSVKASGLTPTPTPTPQLTQDDFYFVYNSNNLPTGSEIEVKTKEAQILATTKTGLSGADSIEWNSSEPSVIDIKDTGTNSQGLFATMERKGPGYSTITAIIKKNGITFTISCQVMVALEVDTDQPVFTFATTNDEKIIKLEKEHATNNTATIPLKYVDNTVINNDTVRWESSNVGVATVDNKGKVTAVGAGVTTIKISTNTVSVKNDRQEKLVTVLVSPKGREFKEATEPQGTWDREFTINNAASNFTIESNASKATDLTWEIYTDEAKTKRILPNDTSLLEYTISNVSGKLNVYNAKAGTYYIYAYSNTKYGNASWNELKVKVVVPISLKPGDVVMNVGDTYNIVNNSNFPHYNIYNYSSSDSTIATVSGRGVITALSKGSVTITLTYQDTSNLYDPSVSNLNKTINVIVIDGISLSSSAATIYVGGTIQLDALTSDPTRKIIWTSDDTSVATVDEGVVTGVNEGTAIITASQVINGVTKTASCIINVQKTITGITIEPSNVTLNINEYATLYAHVTPSALTSVSLKWVSTDEKVVKIVKAGKQEATIQGVSGGTAVIIAVNQNNVVVGSCKVTIKQKVTGITLNETELNVSQSLRTIQLRATITPEYADNKKILWKSTNTKVATVDANGTVTLVGAGSASIIATSEDNPLVTAICNITVGVPVTSITLDELTKTMYVGESTRLGYVITPTNASNKNITWSSTNSSVVSVDSTGLVTARAEGIAVIIVKTQDGSIIRTSTITVKQKATGVALDVKDVEINVGQTFTMPYTITPANATDLTLTWESTDTKVVTVDSKGKITGVSSGKAVIVVKPSIGGAIYANVTVVQQPTEIQLNFEEKTIVVGEKFKLKASFIPSDSTVKGMKWSSSNTKVARVTAAGNVTGLKGGTAIITGKTEDGKLTAFSVVTVVERVTTIKLNKTSYRLGLNKTYTLKATVETNAATNPTVTWSSSDPKIATVDSKGKVTGRKLGYATITAKANDGSNVEASATIRVVRLVTSVKLNRSTVTTVVGRTFQLKATIKPSNATYKTANWSSSDESIAIVDTDGNVTALKEGNVTITAKAKDSSGKSASAYVIVQPRTPSTSVTILNQNLTMVVGETQVLQKAINPIASNDRFTWETDNKTVATVDSSTGKVTARAPGIANVTIMTESGKTATTKITVVGLNTTRLTLEQYSTYTLSVIGINSGINWDVADNEIATVRNGRVESRRTGTTTITATVNGRKLYCTLTVTKIR